MGENGMIKMSRRAFVRLISYTVALIVALSAAAISGYTVANRNRTMIEYGYQRALGELTEYLGNMDIALEKGKYATSPTQMEGLAAKLQREAGYAKNALSRLPVNGEELSGTYRFLSQVGNFCTTLSKRVAEGGRITEEETASLQRLADYAADLTNRLAMMESALAAGQLQLGEVTTVVNRQGGDMDFPSLTDGFLEMEQGFEDYPTLIYDGPFSDHILQQEPKLLAGVDYINEDKAQLAAREFLGGSAVERAGESAGTLPCYQFTMENRRVAISKQGGYVVEYSDSRGIQEAALSVDQALVKGEEALAQKGWDNFSMRYYNLNNGVLIINYAYSKDGVTYYPDLIKIGIAMDNGQLVSLDAKGYIMNHTARELPKAKVSMADAKKKLSPHLQPKDDGKLALIPSEGLKEIACYEFSCIGEDEEQVLVYVNIETGEEEQILILLQDDTGVLAM